MTREPQRRGGLQLQLQLLLFLFPFLPLFNDWGQPRKRLYRLDVEEWEHVWEAQGLFVLLGRHLLRILSHGPRNILARWRVQ